MLMIQYTISKRIRRVFCGEKLRKIVLRQRCICSIKLSKNMIMFLFFIDAVVIVVIIFGSFLVSYCLVFVLCPLFVETLCKSLHYLFSPWFYLFSSCHFPICLVWIWFLVFPFIFQIKSNNPIIPSQEKYSAFA